jgi:hypothetical protein
MSSRHLLAGRARHLSAAVAVGLMAVTCSLSATSAHAETACALTPISKCFGIEAFEAPIIEEDSEPATQAGGHPYELTTAIGFSYRGGKDLEELYGNAKDVHVDLPKGLIIDPDVTPERCTPDELDAEPPVCPEASTVGTTAINVPGVGQSSPLYNMVPPPGTPAALGFNVAGLGVIADVVGGVRTGSGYGLTGSVNDITQVSLVHASITLFGRPSAAGEKAFITMPGACTGEPLEWTVQAISWLGPEASAKYTDPPVTGCNLLHFNPSLSVQPTVASSDSPTGLDVDLHVPQDENVNGLATANLENAKVTLPQGFAVSPSGANGLEACTEQEIELNGPAPAKCPAASSIGSVEVDSPLISHPLPGNVYVAKPTENPFHGLLAIYIAVDDPQTGVVVKLAGHVEANEQTGQLTTTFKENPQLPFEDFKLKFTSGPRAALVTPASCGSYTTTSVLEPWSGNPAAEPGSTSEITGGPGCHGLGFAPSLAAGTVNNEAGAFSPFTMSLKEHDGEQALGNVSITMPPGLLGVIRGVTQCPEPQASRGECTEASLLGEASTAVGPGEDPYWVNGGKVYLTGPYNGGPFGLSIVVPTTAGPFTLNGNAGPGKQVVRASIKVNPHTAQITVASDPSGTYSIPTILQGIPLQIRTIDVNVNRNDFMFNPTNCAQESIQGTIGSAQGASAAVSSPFEAANCAALAFKPSFSVSTHAGHTRRQGAFLHVNVGYTKGQANIAKVHVTLPKKLPARLETLKMACSEAQFAANPSGCPAASFVGTATASTPVLAKPLIGPAIFVSHGGAAFPDLDLVLQGEGITQVLTGNTQVTKVFTSSTFKSVPDVPISSFELTLPEGPHSALGGNGGNLCQGPLYMPTILTGQNGAAVEQKTKVAVTGCKAKGARSKTAAHHLASQRRRR